MRGVLSEQELKDAIQNQTLIKNGNIDNCEGMKYDFRLSNRVLRADFNRPLEFEDSSSNEQAKLIIEPGEVAFVMTEEDLELPGDVFCQLSSKRKLSHGGIIILGGFTVDPNYKGKLIFGLYNISSRNYPIIPGKKLVAGIFYRLDQDEVPNTQRKPESLNDFPDDLIAMIKEYKPVKNQVIETYVQEISCLKEELKAIKAQIDSDKTWKDEFKRAINDNNNQIKEINNTVQIIANQLSKEISDRTQETSRLNEKLASSKAWVAILIAVGSGIFTLFVTWLASLL